MPPDEVTEREALRQAFGNCEAFAELHDQMAKDQPLDHVRIGNQAVHGFGVAPNRARLFARSFAESAIAAQLAKADGEGRFVLLAADNDEQTEDGDLPHQEPLTTEAGDARPAQTGHRIDREPSSALSPTIRQSWPIAGGEIILEVRSQEALPATVFVAIGEVVTKLEELSSSLRRPDGSETDDGGGET
ncbi:MAG: hypothetical protein OXG69_04895 [bacterium]|nr:hypothetical protein [bacterium]